MGEELQETASEKLQLQRLQRGNGSALCQVYPSFYSEFLEQAKQGTQMLPHPSSANEPLALAVFVWIVGSVLPSGTEHPRNAPDALTGCSRVWKETPHQVQGGLLHTIGYPATSKQKQDTFVSCLHHPLVHVHGKAIKFYLEKAKCLFKWKDF